MSRVNIEKVIQDYTKLTGKARQGYYGEDKLTYTVATERLNDMKQK